MGLNKTYLRLNYYIGYYRRLSFKLDPRGGFSQENFVKLRKGDKHYGLFPNNNIMSVSNLSRMERGMIVVKVHVYDLLLEKFGAVFVFRESNIKTQDYLCQRLFNLFFCSSKGIDEIKVEIRKYDQVFRDNCLWLTDLYAIENIFLWFDDNFSLKRNEFHKFVDMFLIFNEILRHLLLYCLAFSCYFNPSLWSSIQRVKQLIGENDFNDELLSAFRYFDQKQYFKLYNVYYKLAERVKPSSHFYKIFIRFKEVILVSESYGTIMDDVFLEKILLLYTTENCQFRKLVIRVYYSKKHIHHDVRYLYLNFLIYEPYPYLIRKLLYNRILSRINRIEYKNQFLRWNEGIFG